MHPMANHCAIVEETIIIKKEIYQQIYQQMMVRFSVLTPITEQIKTHGTSGLCEMDIIVIIGEEICHRYNRNASKELNNVN